MLIPLHVLNSKFHLNVTGVVHIGAHECEEANAYHGQNIPDENIMWIEGQHRLVEQMKTRHPSVKIYEHVISDKDNKEVDFIITNNSQSSSILELDRHKVYHPEVSETNRYKVKTTTVDTLFLEHKEDFSKYNFINIDIQGAELYALQGAKRLLEHVDYLYLEVNQEHLYKECPLVDEIDAFVRSFGFVRVETCWTPWKWGDAFYIKQKQDIHSICGEGKPIQFNPDFRPEYNGELWLWETIRHKVNVLFDVGARTEITYPVRPDTVQHCFEPNPSFFQILANSTRMFPNIITNNIGLGEADSSVTYYEHSQSIAFRQAYRYSCSPSCPCRKTIYLTTLDKYCSTHHIPHIGFLKIDTEGHELAVLKGASNMMANIDFIQFEYGGTYPDASITLQDVYTYLNQHNFRYIYLLHPTYLIHQPLPNNNLMYSNYIATKRPFPEMI